MAALDRRNVKRITYHLFIVEVLANGRKALALIDTGATSSMVTFASAKFLNLTPFLGQKRELILANGTTVGTEYEVDSWVQLKAKRAKLRMIVTPGNQQEILLGVDFLSAMDLVIFGSGYLTFAKDLDELAYQRKIPVAKTSQYKVEILPGYEDDEPMLLQTASLQEEQTLVPHSRTATNLARVIVRQVAAKLVDSPKRPTEYETSEASPESENASAGEEVRSAQRVLTFTDESAGEDVKIIGQTNRENPGPSSILNNETDSNENGESLRQNSNGNSESLPTYT